MRSEVIDNGKSAIMYIIISLETCGVYGLSRSAFPACSGMSTPLYIDGTIDRLSAFARNATRINTPRKIIRAHEEQGAQVLSNLGNPIHPWV